MLFEERRHSVFRKTDHLFAWLMIFQWLAGIGIALWISPRTWSREASEVHPHVWAAILLGGSISLFPAYLAWKQPGKTLTRHTIAIGQTLTSALLIHLTGGRIETHFHVFGSLAFLAFYRDWKVLVTASFVVTVDHFLRGVYWPQSVYGILSPSPWRFLEHAGWVVFENIFLIRSCLYGVREMRNVSQQRAELEGINERVEKKVEERTKQLVDAETRTRSIIECSHDGFIAVNAYGMVTSWNARSEEIFGYHRSEALGRKLADLIIPPQLKGYHNGGLGNFLVDEKSSKSQRIEIVALHRDGKEFPIELAICSVQVEGDFTWNAFVQDVSARRRREMELRQTQRLESVGQLAAGIAHEINTPVQFVGDNARFFKGAFEDLQRLIDEYRLLGANAPGVDPQVAEALARIEREVDLPYLKEEIPKAIGQTLDGINRVSTIVRAMKDFAHPDAKEKAPSDLNQALRSTLTVACNEIKYVADVETDFGKLPPVVCHLGDLNQVFLNLLVNASQAIEEIVKNSGKKGTIRVKTQAEGPNVSITISDTGGGIPQAIRSRVFDPFFTTKPVGKGTGQGLSMARSIIVERHGGRIDFESTEGVGTSFRIQLPIDGVSKVPMEVAG